MPEEPQSKNAAFWNFIFTIFYAALVAGSLYFLKIDGKLENEFTILDFFLLGLATFRMTHLLVYDHITGYIRDYFSKFEKGPGHTISNLLSCPWCTGIWMALVASFFYFLTPLTWYIIFIVALAGLATFFEIIILRIDR
jgi:hypothetical protein